MSLLKLYLLGTPRLEQDGTVLEVDTRKAIAMLAYLALSGERQSRDSLAAFFWPDFDNSRAKAALRRTLSALKATVGSAAIFASREVIGVERDRIWCDLWLFRHSLSTVTGHVHETKPLCAACQQHLEAAVFLYRNDFMAGFSLRDSAPFDDWQLFHQEALRQDLAQALAQLTQITTGDTAIAHARRWCRLDPLLEEAHRHLMQLLAANDRHADALRQYRDCVRILDEELGVSPLPETTALYHAIQNDRASQPVAPLPILISPSPRQPSPLIGREDDLGLMQQLYARVGPDGRLLIIEGEPGIGKTRLAETFLAWAVAAGAPTIKARCYEGESNLAYAPIIQVLQEGLATATNAEVDALPAHHLAAAARLLPGMAGGRALPPSSTFDAPGEQVHFYEGIAHLLTTWLGGTTPGVLWLDDVHWLDTASQELLLYLLHRWQKRPFLILFCWRAEELPPAFPLSALAATLRRAGASETVRPSRFTINDVQKLLTVSGMPLPTDLPARLFAETEGLPFFVVEYLNALAQNGEPLTADGALVVPATVRDLLHSRLAQIGAAERQILQTASAIGHSFELGLVHAGSGRSAEEAVTALETLTSRGLLREQTAVYDFSHDKLRALVYEEMGLARRRLLHRRLADTLSARRAAPTTTVSAQIATHYQLAGAESEAAAYFVEAGDQARALFAHHDALHNYRSALALGASEAWRLHSACGELSMRLGAYPDALSSYETAAALAPPAELGHLEHQLAKVYQRQGKWSLAAHTLAQAQGNLGETAAAATLAHLTIDRSLVAHRQKQPDAALALAQQARTLAETAADGSMVALADNLLGMLARSRGEVQTAVTLLEQSRQLADASDRLDIQIAARNNLALALSSAGQLAEAQTHLQQALALCQRLGDRHQEAALRSNLADVLHQAGEDSAAQAQIRRSATIYAEIGREKERWRAEIWQLMEW